MLAAEATGPRPQMDSMQSRLHGQAAPPLILTMTAVLWEKSRRGPSQASSFEQLAIKRYGSSGRATALWNSKSVYAERGKVTESVQPLCKLCVQASAEVKAAVSVEE